MGNRFLLLVLASAVASAALAQSKPVIDPERVERAVKDAWRGAPPEWQARLVPDETMRQCSAHDNGPPQAIFESIQAREKATIRYPADGTLLGDWRNGEKFAQSGYGLRFTDYPPRGPNGGNCYACHQLTKQEVSYGTIGPSLLGYGKLRDFSPEAVKAAYEKIYNPHATFPCSLMPRFGSNQVLTIDQIKDLVALLMDAESLVNKD
jgi:L-cysteine S-thiosulfotransferase